MLSETDRVDVILDSLEVRIRAAEAELAAIKAEAAQNSN